MNRLFSTALFSAALLAANCYAATSETVSETRPLDARVTKIKLGGAVDLRVRQGATVSLVISGDRDDVASVATTQTGDTLQIDMKSSRFNMDKHPQLHAELTLPAVRELVSQGAGAAEMSGFSGDDVKLALQGAGSMTMTGQFKNLEARLSGVGSMTLNAGESENVKLNLSGAGRLAINGQTKRLHAKLGGLGSLDARQLQSNAVELNLSGLGSASVYAKSAADVNLSGLGSATVYGKPAKRIANSSGLGSINWD